VGLGVDRLVFFTDVPGVYLDGVVAERISPDEADRLLAGGALEGGIVPKLRAGATAARHGVATAIGGTTIG
jgi:acetylglutamate kinase